MTPAIFFDRDGTLIRDVHYLKDPEAIEWLPDVFEVLRLCLRRHFKLFIVTNQSGIGRGLFSEEDYRSVTRKLEEEARDRKILFSGIYHCPHRPEDLCFCRKPSPGLFSRALREHKIDVTHSWVVGDRERDLIPGRCLHIAHSLLLKPNEGLGALKGLISS